MTMKFWPGVLMVLISGWLMMAALRARRRAQARRPGDSVGNDATQALANLGYFVPPLVITALAIAAAAITVAFFATGADQVFSTFDLAGFLLLMGTYGYWVLMSTRAELPYSADD